ncbi:MAG: hypothetical protein NWE94_04815 [Candidatus Bathyarchaeota archaeon]|nr:hypothetical protein [Candidatus Bathyarchaeota archaeon]
MVEAIRIGTPKWLQKIEYYVVNRQNEDGGYTFAQGSESNGQDTYYGLAILNLLKTKFPNAEKTTKFLDEIRLDSIYGIYYTVKSSLLLGKDLNPNLKKRLKQTLESKQYFGSINFFSEVSSEFITTFMALELAHLLEIDVNTEAAKWLMKFRNSDGGFGTYCQSNINSTYYAVASMKLAKANLSNMHETVNFVRACEKPYGGFTVIPINYAPYMEHTYYGIMTLDLLGEKSKYPAQTIDWVLKCQRRNGGFARSDLGISTFIDTYHALTVLQKLTNSGELR